MNTRSRKMLMSEATFPVVSERTRALVLGVNGQDGSYIADVLIKKGWFVIGVGRQSKSRWIDESSSGYSYHRLDLSDDRNFSAFLIEFMPSVIFHLAATHGPSGFNYEAHWRDAHAVNTLSVHAALEHLRCQAPNAVFVYASSSKVFRTSTGGVFTEFSPRESSCIYSTTKNAATDLINYYRHQHQLKASVVWTFNHESPRRLGNYFIPKLVNNLAHALVDRAYSDTIDSLAFWCDWGDARDYAAIIASIAAEAPGEDFIIASGKTLWAEDFVSMLYASHGLSYQNHLHVKNPVGTKRPNAFWADISLLRQRISVPQMRSIFEISDDILLTNHPHANAQSDQN